ncbi:SPAG1 family protein [Megaselia abdita]
MSTKKKTLLEKYDIPISYLDFAYVEKCTNPREMEKIVNILRSGEEGYYPALTKRAEEKLLELKPNSKLFRTEEDLLTKSSISLKEWESETNPIVDWSSDVKNVDKFLQKIGSSSNENCVETVPRKTKKIILGGNTTKDTKTSDSKSQNRIKSTDYSAWDKFDAETEILKMDLEEEKVKEEVERMNRLNLQSSKDLNEDLKIDHLTMIEREKLAVSFKDRGNDYFRAKEYQHSLKEYNKSIEIFPTAMAFNNRAITNIKLKDFKNALEDSKKCLEREPGNIKALFRKAESLLGLNRNSDAVDTYLDIMEIEPSNVHALKAYNDLSGGYSSNRKAKGTRIMISDGSTGDSNESADLRKNKDVKPKKKVEDYSELIKPEKTVKNKFFKAMENISKKPTETPPPEEQLNLNFNLESSKANKVLIEEI